jgi:hypothetical protein
VTPLLALLRLPEEGGIPFLEQNARIIYPALAVLVVALLAAGVIHAWKSQEMDGVQKAQLKGEILRLMRRYVGGITADQLCPELKLDTFGVARLLDEMVKEGIVTSYTTSDRITTFRLKGLDR